MMLITVITHPRMKLLMNNYLTAEVKGGKLYTKSLAHLVVSKKKCKRECGDMLHGNHGNSHGILALGSMYLAYNKTLIGKVHSFNTFW